jgi:apolipoprotein N-acyltransferase
MPRENTPQEIIAAARAAPAGVKGAFLVSGLTAVLMWAAFTPIDFGPLAWLCLVPLLMLVRLARPVGRMYTAVFAGGLLFWGLALQWLRLGHPAGYAAWGALAVYMALYFLLFVALSRVAVWRLRVPLTVAAPIVWVGLEVLRGYLMTGFSWYYLAHTQYRWIELIQISDLVGAYGVSFLVALVAACATELVPVTWFQRLGLLAPGVSEGVRVATPLGKTLRVAGCLAVFAAALSYGYFRRAGNEFGAGPRAALVQGNFTSKVKGDPNDWPRMERKHEELTGEAVKQQPDLIVWPETMFTFPLFETPPDVSDADLQEAHPDLPIERLRELKVRTKLATLAQMAGSALVIGLETLQVDREHIRRYNSAVLVRPDGTLGGRYDKLHRVVFGEFIPLVETFPWLRRLTPFPENFGISPGKSAVAFEHQGFRFAPIICFEDTVPQVVRTIVNATTEQGAQGPKRVDCLVNLTNDGWFHGSSELDQHLITAVFRCVECRTPMVRAVNTGISAIIDGDGVIRKRAAKSRDAVVVGDIPLDGRKSLYLAGGDWFAGSCLAFCVYLLLAGLFGGWIQRRAPELRTAV